MPKLLGWSEDPERMFLVLEDLTGARWPPPWRPGDFEAARAALDWNQACVGNPAVDLAAWLPSLSLEGGPGPWRVMPDSHGLAALLAGFFGSRAGQPPPSTAAPRVRDFQRAQAEVCWPGRGASSRSLLDF